MPAATCSRTDAPRSCTLVLLIGSIYCLVPVTWVLVASTRSSGELFSTFTFAPGTGLLDNLRNLFTYGNGLYLRWTANNALYAVVAAADPGHWAMNSPAVWLRTVSVDLAGPPARVEAEPYQDGQAFQAQRGPQVGERLVVQPGDQGVRMRRIL